MPRAKQPKKESSPFIISPTDALCGSFVKDARYNDLYKEVMAARTTWLSPNPLEVGIKIFEYLEFRGKNAAATLLRPLPESEEGIPPGLDADGFPRTTNQI